MTNPCFRDLTEGLQILLWTNESQEETKSSTNIIWNAFCESIMQLYTRIHAILLFKVYR